MFLGEFEHSVDSKGRVAVPAKFRPELENGLVVTRGIARCLQVYPTGAWQVLVDKVNSLPLGAPRAIDIRRRFFAGAFDTEVDKQGRILLPALLRAYAGISEEVVFVGLSSSFEIWSEAAWAITRAELDEQGEAIAAAMAELGI
jgi:MraZ protein